MFWWLVKMGDGRCRDHWSGAILLRLPAKAGEHGMCEKQKDEGQLAC
jgi:hypothetical protein